MNEIQLQEKQLYENLSPLFTEQGYELQPSKKQFRMKTKTGFRSVLVLVHGNRSEQTIDLNLGVRMDLVEELVNQFLEEGTPQLSKDSNTFIASYGRLVRKPAKRFLIKSEADLVVVCQRIEAFMRSKGFALLQRIDNLRKLDKVLNRKPDQACPYLFNQVSRCFKGITIAKMTHRTDFNHIAATYLRYLNNQWAPQGAIENYKKLLRYLQHFSMN